MSALNEATGDGRFIDISKVLITKEVSEENFLKMSKKEIEDFEKGKEAEIAQSCAQQLANRYQGARSLGTCIYAKVPDPKTKFFFDEEFMKACHLTKGKAKNIECAGSHYYLFLLQEFERHYIRCDNGVEAVQQDIARIPAPVPDLSTREENGKWHYHTPDTLPEELKNNREPDDFCPRVQLKQIVHDAGNPIIETQVTKPGW